MDPIVSSKARLPLISAAQSLDVEAELSRFEAEERERLGLIPRRHWVESMTRPKFTRKERGHVTLLVGGLTRAHDQFVQGALQGIGYNVLALDCPDEDAYRTGKEFGNRAQCNPTYFTVGNLVKFLIQLRDEQGLSSQDIIKNYVFLTAGACGPCRFGMYVTEYRKALRDAGFDGFRVMLFQQQGGLDQATGEDSGLELGPKFFLALLKALVAGDIINAVTYRIRPYEVEPGATDRALARAKEICTTALKERTNILWALSRAKKEFQAVQVDRLRCKPRVAIIGEFWAMTTEGDGNYRLQRFIEEEGGECDVQLVTAWLLYNVWEVAFDTQSRADLRGADQSVRGLEGLGRFGLLKREGSLWAADKAIRAAFQAFAKAGGLEDYHLPDMDRIADLAHEHYNNDLRGGEGHMEVGKLILNVLEQKATMTLSVKPFGCMPSSGVSDGVQSLVTERHPGSIFCAVETSGDGAVNFQSRVQMYMFKARQAAQKELDQALAKHGVTLEAVRDAVARDPRLRSALHRSPHCAAHTAADLVNEVAPVLLGKPRARFKVLRKLTDRAATRLGLQSGLESAVAAE